MHHAHCVVTEYGNPVDPLFPKNGGSVLLVCVGGMSLVAVRVGSITRTVSSVVDILDKLFNVIYSGCMLISLYGLVLELLVWIS